MANLRISILDGGQNPLDDTVDIVLKHLRLTDTRTVRNQSAKKRITITDLNAGGPHIPWPIFARRWQMWVFSLGRDKAAQIFELSSPTLWENRKKGHGFSHG